MLENLKLSPQSQAVFHIDAEAHEAVFSSWTVSTGCYLSGYSKGEPRIPERLQPNSMCLLTERPRGCSEAERRIVGAFMVEDDFIGTCCTDGTIQAHPTHRIPAAAGTSASLLALCGQGAGKTALGQNGLQIYVQPHR